MIESGCTGWRWLAAGGLPRIKPDVVMITTGGDKCCTRAETLHEREPEHAAIKFQRPLNIRDLEMNMPNAHRRIDERRRFNSHVLGYAEQSGVQLGQNREPRNDLKTTSAQNAKRVKVDAPRREGLTGFAALGIRKFGSAYHFDSGLGIWVRTESNQLTRVFRWASVRRA